MGTKRPNKRKNWDLILKEIGKKAGFEIIGWDPYPARKSKVLIKCPHQEKWVYAHGQLNKTSCCKVSSKENNKNPMYNKTPWNKDKICPGIGGRPKGVKNSKPYSQETLKKYSEARKRITKNGQWWSGFQRPQDSDRPDKLYFIRLYNGKYKVGRSYKGWLYRKKETAELLGEWSGKSIDIWNLERKVLKEFSQYKAPLNEMSMGRGMTEHFSEILPVQAVISFIEKHLFL
jgi:hypothetical protein